MTTWAILIILLSFGVFMVTGVFAVMLIGRFVLRNGDHMGAFGSSSSTFPAQTEARRPASAGSLAVWFVAFTVLVLFAVSFLRAVRTPGTLQVHNQSAALYTDVAELPPQHPEDNEFIRRQLGSLRNLQDARDKLNEAVRSTRIIIQSDGGPIPEGASFVATDSGVITLELSADALREINSRSHAELLRMLSEKLPERLKQAAPLISITSAGAPRGHSLPAIEGLRQLAAALSTMIRELSADDPELTAEATVTAHVEADVAKADVAKADVAEADVATKGISPPSLNPSTAVPTPPVPAVPAALVPPALVPAPVAPAAAVASVRSPDWLRQQDGRRIVVETPFLPASDDISAALNKSISGALQEHLEEQTRGRLKPPTDWTQLVQLQLTDAAVKACVVATYDREEVIETREGPQSMRKTIALVEFPEKVDATALARIHESIQQQRVGVVGVIVGLLCAAALLTGLIIRFASGGPRWRTILASCALLLLPLPLLLISTGLILSAGEGRILEFPWQSIHQRTIVDVSH